jgi:UTP--glucose-1-phosphate uridylyltransferase
LAEKNKSNVAKELNQFYEKLRNTHIAFVNQPEPRGFGDAVYLAKAFTGDEAFMVHAGDDLIISKGNSYFNMLRKTFEEYDADAVFCVEKVKDPKRYGVIQGKRIGEKLYQVSEVQEKPQHPKSNLAIVAIYVFSRKIYDCIERVKHAHVGELQLTDAIQRLLDDKRGVYAVELNSCDKRIDVGTSESYWSALSLTKKLNTCKQSNL